MERWRSPVATPATEALSLRGLRLPARALPAMQARPPDLGPRLQSRFGVWQAVACPGKPRPTRGADDVREIPALDW